MNTSSSSNNSTILTDSIVEVLLYVFAFIIGIDCAVNSVYFMISRVHWAVTCVCAFSAFVLNFILYRKDGDELKDFLRMLYHWDTWSFKDLATSLVTIMNGFVMYIFTSQSYASLMLNPAIAAFVPSVMPFVFCMAYGIGTCALMYRPVKDGMIQLEASFASFMKAQWVAPSPRDVVLYSLGTINALLLTCSSFYCVVKDTFGGLSKTLNYLAHFVFSAFVATEIKFSVDVNTNFADHLEQNSFANEAYYGDLGLFSLANAVANGFITLGEVSFGLPGSVIVFMIGAMSSYFTMFSGAYDSFYEDTKKSSNSSHIKHLSYAKILGIDHIYNHCSRVANTFNEPVVEMKKC